MIFYATMRLKNLMKARQSSDKYSEVQFLAEGRCEVCLHNSKWYAFELRARISSTLAVGINDKNSFRITSHQISRKSCQPMQHTICSIRYAAHAKYISNEID